MNCHNFEPISGLTMIARPDVSIQIEKYEMFKYYIELRTIVLKCVKIPGLPYDTVIVSIIDGGIDVK